MFCLNNKRRSVLKEVLYSIDSIYNEVDSVLTEEQDCMDNFPENLQGSENYERMEETVDKLEDILETISSLRDDLSDVI